MSDCVLDRRTKEQKSYATYVLVSKKREDRRAEEQKKISLRSSVLKIRVTSSDNASCRQQYRCRYEQVTAWGDR